MSRYGQLLQMPGVTPLIASQLVARAPSGMLTIAIIMRIHDLFNSYSDAGLTVAAFSLGAAIAGPVTSRWMALWGMRQVLSTTTLVFTVTLTTVAVATMPLPAYLAAGLVLGAATPPIQPAVRTIYPKIVNARQLPALFSLDASAQELIWVFGPMVAAFVAVQFSPTAAILLACVLAFGGSAWFIAQPSVGSVRIPRSARRLGTVLMRPPVFFVVVIGLTLIAASGAIEAATVATFSDEGAASGLILAVWSIGSFGGGLLSGNARITSWSLFWRLTFVFVGMSLAAIFMNAWWIGAMLLISGLGFAPTIAVLYAVVSSSVRFSDTPEAYGWLGTGQLIGLALGSAVAGFAVDTWGGQGAFIVSAAIAIIPAVLAVVARPWMPDLSGGAGPLPDTSSTPVVG